MSDRKPIRVVTVDRLGELADDMPGVHLCDLPPFTTLLVETVNSVYRVVITQGPEVYVQGGSHFPEPTPVRIDGAGLAGSFIKAGWIVVGLLMQIRVGDRRVVSTSPVHAIYTAQAPGQVVH